MALGGVIFDWDGVVINSASLHEESWELLANELNLPLPKDHFERGFGKRNDVIIPEILQWSHNKADIKNWGIRKEELYRELGKKRGIPILKGVREFLDSLKLKNIPCVIGTSTEKKNLNLAFEQLNIAHFFSGAACAEDVIHGKPNPEVFIKAAQIIKKKPSSCVVLEDSTHGIIAAKTCGMMALGLSTTRKKEELIKSGADYVVKDPSFLNISLLQSLFTN